MTTSLKEMPKIELHCHLDGSMRLEVIRKLLMEMGQEYSCDQLKEQLCAPWNCVSLAEYLKCFDLPIQCLQTYHGLEKAAFDLAAQAAEEIFRNTICTKFLYWTRINDTTDLRSSTKGAGKSI